MKTSPSPNSVVASVSPIRLLVVDDDPLSSTFQSHLAQLLGHRADVETHAERVVERAVSGNYDLMLLDLGMPYPDGFELLRRLREAEVAANRPPLPVIAVTGYASEADRLRCLLAGFTDHLAKPVQATTLSSMIERVVAAAGERRANRESDAERLRATVRRLSEVRPDDRSFAPTVTESFALRSAQLLETLRAATQARDAGQIARGARALKSSAEFLGALRLAGMCAELETQAAAGDWDLALTQLAAMEHEHQAVLTLLFESSR